MNYWLIVAAKDKVDKKVSAREKWERRKQDCFWGIPDRARNVSKITHNDKAIIYIGGTKKFVGPIRVLSSVHFLTDEEQQSLWKKSLAFAPLRGFFFNFDQARLGECKVDPILKHLPTIKKNWPQSIRASMVAITAKEYKTILDAMAEKPAVKLSRKTDAAEKRVR